MGSKAVEFHEAASLEFEAAFAWYFERSERAALRFARKVERAVTLISEAPERFPAGVRGTRRFLLKRFPFALVYRNLPSAIQVVAVAHGCSARGIGKSGFSKRQQLTPPLNPSLTRTTSGRSTSDLRSWQRPPVDRPNSFRWVLERTNRLSLCPASPSLFREWEERKRCRRRPLGYRRYSRHLGSHHRR
jgi:toxin ParE1/3/4